MTVDELILMRDWVKLRQMTRVESFGAERWIPVGAIGKVLKVGPDAALVRFQKFGPTNVGFSDIERASFIDMIPVRLRPIARRFGGWLVGTAGALVLVALTVAVTLVVTRVITGR